MARRVTANQLIEAGKRLFSLLLAIYLVFLLGRAIYINFKVRQRISEIEAEIKFLRAENQRLTNLIAYYQTETFRELEARSKLGLKKPGEIVIALPENSDEEASEEQAPIRRPPEEPKETPNYIKWWEYLFGE